jgi:heat shock protein HtpX
VRAVLAHEMGHVYNGDMFTTTVLAGLMNTFVYFISRWVYRNLAERNEALAFGVYIGLQILLSFLAMIPISWFSRRREFAADAFSARVYGRETMISALHAINRWITRAQAEFTTQDPLATMKIAGKSGGFVRLFATHPPIEERVAALQRL